ncbi:MAG: lysine--tRNA ligase [Euryarchaeota archaeon]|nr:lysine--tRNA ligase [Euryarchaeota archaeon]
MEKESLFWADQKAEEIADRKKFHYLDKKIPEFKKYTIKTSASISGVLHIGRLSDTIRSESVCRALKEHSHDSEMIWVAEDMDPLRKIPEGVPGEFSKYLGMPVSEILDPWGCHSSYAEHHVSEYLEVIDEFVDAKIAKYSMSEEYRKGNFKPYIRAILDNLEKIIEIQNKYRETPLKRGWSPWVPRCKGCGKVITPRIKEIEENKVAYKCEDYSFETQVALGCGYEGEANPLRDRGKLLWKGEWAAQWARWKIAAEGAGKEYVVPTSAWWVNAGIVERIFDFPSPVPIFYEHLVIDGKKMSASLGNVVYPKDWLSAAPTQLLRFFYNKKLMKTRSFSWKDLPNLYDEYDEHARIYFEKKEDSKEIKHMRRLYEISQLGGIDKPVSLPFSHAALISQVFPGEDAIISSLKHSGHYEEKNRSLILKRIELARNWAQKYAPEEARISLSVDVEKIKAQLSGRQKELLQKLAAWLEKDRSAEEIQVQVYQVANEMKIPLSEAFQAVYLSTTGKTKGPKAGALIASLDRKWVIKRFREVSG